MIERADRPSVRLVYVHSSPVISETAGGGFAVHTAHALARQVSRVTLIVGGHPSRPSAAEVLDYYGLDPVPELDMLIVPPFRIPGTRIRWNGVFRQKAIHRIRQIQKQECLDAVICRNLKFVPRLMPVRTKNTKLIYEPHRVYHYDTGQLDPSVEVTVSKKNLDLERMVYDGVDGLVVLGNSFAEKVGTIFGLRIPFCVAPSGVLPVEPVPGKERSHTICYSGQLHKHKGVDLLIESVKHLKDESVEVLVVGGNDRLDELRAVARSTGLAHRITFTGHVGFREAQQLVGRTKLAVAPLLTCDQNCYYTSPLKLFEYMAMQVPVVASRIPAVSEVITDGETGILVEPDGPQSLANGIDRVLENADLYNKIKRQAYEKVITSYTWDARARTLIEFIRDL